MHLHGEHLDDAVSGFTFLSLSRCIGRVHVSMELPPFVHSVYNVATTADHPAMVMQVGPAEAARLPPHYRFYSDMFKCEDGSRLLQELLQAWGQLFMELEAWSDGVHQAIRAAGDRWRL